MTLVVAPVKTTTEINRAAKTVVSTQCGVGQVAYQVKLAVFGGPIIGLVGVESEYIYWNWLFSCYANINCKTRVCGDAPSVSLNSTETVFIPVGGSFGDTSGKLSQVNVSISS